MRLDPGAPEIGGRRGDFEGNMAGRHQGAVLERQFRPVEPAEDIGRAVSENLAERLAGIIAFPFQLHEARRPVRFRPMNQIDCSAPVSRRIADSRGHRALVEPSGHPTRARQNGDRLLQHYLGIGIAAAYRVRAPKLPKLLR